MAISDDGLEEKNMKGKLVSSIREAIKACGLKDGMCVSFHHHLRNGDHVLNMVMAEIADMGFHDICVSASSIHEAHYPLCDLLEQGVVSGIDTNYISASVGRDISRGVLDKPVTLRSHGGRAGAVYSGECHIDIAFMAAPTADCMGNVNGVEGPSACGALGYAFEDMKCADKVVVITDNLVPYPLQRVSIDETTVDYVVKVDSIGDPDGIVSGTTRITRDPIGLKIARLAADVIENSGLLTDGFAFQTGAGGASLAVTQYLKDIMLKKHIVGSYALGGITGYLVDMLETGLFESIQDVQCFDLRAVQSIRSDARHKEISGYCYASSYAKSCAVNSLDAVILGATEIDTDFNVNVHTDSGGFIMGGSGGHADAANGAKLSIIVAPAFRTRLPTVRDHVGCISTPGCDVDVLVTQYGVSVNPRNEDLRQRLADARVPMIDIHELKDRVERITGAPMQVKHSDKVVANVLDRNNRELDKIYQVI